MHWLRPLDSTWSSLVPTIEVDLLHWLSVSFVLRLIQWLRGFMVLGHWSLEHIDQRVSKGYLSSHDERRLVLWSRRISGMAAMTWWVSGLAMSSLSAISTENDELLRQRLGSIFRPIYSLEVLICYTFKYTSRRRALIFVCLLCKVYLENIHALY